MSEAHVHLRTVSLCHGFGALRSHCAIANSLQQYAETQATMSKRRKIKQCGGRGAMPEGVLWVATTPEKVDIEATSLQPVCRRRHTRHRRDLFPSLEYASNDLGHEANSTAEQHAEREANLAASCVDSVSQFYLSGSTSAEPCSEPVQTKFASAHEEQLGASVLSDDFSDAVSFYSCTDGDFPDDLSESESAVSLDRSETTPGTSWSNDLVQNRFEDEAALPIEDIEDGEGEAILIRGSEQAEEPQQAASTLPDDQDVSPFSWLQ